MRILLISLFWILTSLTNSSARNKSLEFTKNGDFKILQFTDTHLDPQSGYRQIQGNKTFARISMMIRSEKPNFIVFTGDIVTGSPASTMWKRLIDSLNTYKIPFCVTLGNHDAEQDISRQEIARLVTSSPYCLNTLNKANELADIRLDIVSQAEKKTAFSLYCMDSHDYSTIEGIGGYGWFSNEQIEWLKSSCKEHTKNNGGKPIPSLAFFHIALQEYVTAWKNNGNTRIGRAAEAECPGALNSGMYSAMIESGSVIGTFVGHDHDIDYIVAEKGIALGYGRFSGDDTTYNNLRPGARVIILTEGLKGFRTFIKEDDGRIVDHIIFENEKISKFRK